jgi:peroxiredoxin
MHAAELAIRVALAIVFGAAGAAKLLDLQASRDTTSAFGVPERAARVSGTLLPFAELATALALLLQPTARWAAVAAAALLVLFSGGVGFALAQGRTPNCNCFGQVSSEQISWRTLVRNAVFAVAAGFVICEGAGASLQAWTSDRTAANLVGGLALTACAFAVIAALHFWRRSVSLREALARGGDGTPELAVGATAPAFTLTALDGQPISLEHLRSAGLPVLLVFASPICVPCRTLLPELGRWSNTLSDRIRFAVVESGVHDPTEFAEQIGASGELIGLVEPEFAVAAAYGVQVTPSAFLIDADGNIAAPATPGANAIEQLLRKALRAQQPASLSEVA